jgi:hypothetical protein
MGTWSFPGVESGRGVALTPHPLLVPWSKNRVAIPLLSLRAFVAYKKGEIYLISQEPMIPLEGRFNEILIEFGPHENVSLIKTCLSETYSRVRVGKNICPTCFLLGMV